MSTPSLLPFSRTAAGRCGSGRLLRLPPRNPGLPECAPSPLLHRHLLRPAGPFSTSTSSVAPNLLILPPPGRSPGGRGEGGDPLTASSSAQAPGSLPNVPAAPRARAGPRPLTALGDCRSTQAVSRTSASGLLQIRENLGFRLSLSPFFFYRVRRGRSAGMPFPLPALLPQSRFRSEQVLGLSQPNRKTFLCAAQCRRPELREGVA